ncbi:MAG: sigma-54-dependent Fis family transcriptional regulator [Burkholderiales bacterium]|nr:sigma-54-dependent Fis family transcriptional regulator [Burkholderiales bacterium]
MTAPRILIVDDEADLRELVEITLVRMGLDVDSADSLAPARALLKQRAYALVLTDMRLPDGLGIELVREVATEYRNTPIAVITAFGSAENAVTALKAGAFDYLSKPVGLDQLRLLVQSALRISMASEVQSRPHDTTAKESPLRLIGRSAVMQDVRAQILRLARSMAPIAITGESGSGKELAARDIHAQSARVDKPFVAVNCGAIPEALMEAEFFGYRKGAFTGAADDRDGFFQAANGGTLMLDEVADLPLAMQVKLLRAIQERRVRKVGATVEEPVDVRIISATHQNLVECVERGKFRQDLYYRLNVIELRLPPLRERRDDIDLLADAILTRLSAGGGKVTLSGAALDALCGYSFPGNVRELENILERALAFANDGIIEVADLALKANGATVESLPQPAEVPVLEPAPEPPAEFAQEPEQGSSAGASPTDLPLSLPDYLDQVERDLILRALGKTRFNRTHAAELLGISFRQLRYRMQRLNIREPD